MKKEWYTKVEAVISRDLEHFYQTVYGNFIEGLEVQPLGNDSYRLNPCPVCGHSDAATVGVAVNCFSLECDWSGTHISAWTKYATALEGLSYRAAIKHLEDFTGIPFPGFTEKDIEEFEEQELIQLGLRTAREFYHNELMNCKEKFLFNGTMLTPLEYLTDVRMHKLGTITHFKVGFGKNFLELRQKLLALGLTKEQIRELPIWVYDNTFVYYYQDSRGIRRFNTKNPFGTIARVKNKTTGEWESTGKPVAGYSRGTKDILFSGRRFNFDEPIVLVEGEDDVMSVFDNGFENVGGIGGNLDEASASNIIKDAKSTVYLMFDNDKAGERYTHIFNEQYPDKDIRRIRFPESINDPNDYYRSSQPKHMDLLCEEAESLPSDGYRIYNKSLTEWVVKTRTKTLNFTLDYTNDSKSKAGEFCGTIDLYENGKLVDKELNKNLTTAKQNKKPYNFYLYEEMNTYFNDISDKDFDELIKIYRLSGRKDAIIKKLAKEVHAHNNDTELINKLKLGLTTPDGREDVIDKILMEANDINNKSIDTSVTIPKIKVSQYFNTRNKDGYFYFLRNITDGDTLRRLPFLLRNDGELIRLDLLKRKDPQCLLLIDNKYELPYEIEEAIMDPLECSLTENVVERYVEGNIPKQLLLPEQLAREIQEYLRRFFYSNEDYIYYVLTLYVILTYYYELFDQMPYLFLNGAKGSGKTVLGSALNLLCFNAKMATQISDASLFRITSLEGGTLILDEMETLTSRTKGADSTMGTLLKGGYKRSSNIYRADVESEIKVQKYDSYGPKIIINIFGLDDVIEDRCLPINCFGYKPTSGIRLEDPKAYLKNLDPIRDLTSRCCLSALENFQALDAMRHDHYFETSNARLSEILTPVLVIARFVDTAERKAILEANSDLDEAEIIGTYEKAVSEYYHKKLKHDKELSMGNTPEGIIKDIVPRVAEELYGLVPEDELHYTVTENHKYDEEIAFDKAEGWFELNTLHLKVFIEENMPGDTVYTNILTRWLRTCYKFNEEDVRRTVANISNDDLIREMKGNTNPKVQTYRFFFKDFLKEEDLTQTKYDVTEPTAQIDSFLI